MGWCNQPKPMPKKYVQYSNKYSTGKKTFKYFRANTGTGNVRNVAVGTIWLFYLNPDFSSTHTIIALIPDHPEVDEFSIYELKVKRVFSGCPCGGLVGCPAQALWDYIFVVQVLVTGFPPFCIACGVCQRCYICKCIGCLGAEWIGGWSTWPPSQA